MIALSSVLSSELHKDWLQKTSFSGVVIFSREKKKTGVRHLYFQMLFIFISFFFACLLQLYISWISFVGMLYLPLLAMPNVLFILIYLILKKMSRLQFSVLFLHCMHAPPTSLFFIFFYSNTHEMLGMPFCRLYPIHSTLMSDKTTTSPFPPPPFFCT